MGYVYGIGEVPDDFLETPPYRYGTGTRINPDPPPVGTLPDAGYALYRPTMVPTNIKNDDWPDEVGNIDLWQRPQFQNKDGSVSTEQSFSVNMDGMEVLLPKVITSEDETRVVDEKEAIEHFKKTGEHLGKFHDVDRANRYAQKLHEWQELGLEKPYFQEAMKQYGDKPIPLKNPNPWGKSVHGQSGRPEFAPASFSPDVQNEPDPLEGIEEEDKDFEQQLKQAQGQPETDETEAAPSPSAQRPSGIVPDRDERPQGITLDDKSSQPQAPQEHDIPHFGNLYPTLAEQRASIIAEIDKNPSLRDAAAAVVSQEGRGADTIQAIVEALVNRTQQRGTSIQRELTNGFYGPVINGHVNRILERNGGKPEQWMLDQFDTALNAVRNGSDLIEGRTDQGMANEIHGPATMYGSEYFGDMGGDPTWRIRHQRNKGDPGGAYVRPTSADARPEGITLDEQPAGQAQAPPGQRAPSKFYAPNVNPDLLSKVDLLQQDFGRGFHLNSGYRSPAQNLQVGGERASEHLHGNAVDIDVSDMSKEQRIELIEQASARGITGIGVYNNALHFDLGGKRAWGPDHHKGSIPDWAAPVLARHMAGKTELVATRPQGISPDVAKEEDQRPAGIKLDTQPTSPAGITPDQPVEAQVTGQQLPSGEVAPGATEAQREAVAAQGGGDAEKVSRQMQAAQNRDRLQSEIQKVEAAGYKTPHYIGTPAEPEGDRAPTMDMENLVTSLRKQSKDAAKKGDMETAAYAGKEAKYWEEKIKTEGMTAEEWKKGTGEDFPHGPLPRLSPSVARQLGLDRWIDQTSGAEVRKAHFAKEPLPKIEDVAPFPGELTPGQEALVKRKNTLQAERDKLTATWTPDQPEKTKQIADLDKQIAEQEKAFSQLGATQEKLTPAQIRDIATGKAERKGAFQYPVSLAATGGQALEQGTFSTLKGTQGIVASATRKLVNPYANAEEAKAALPTLESQLKIFKEGADKEAASYDPNNIAQVKRFNAYNEQVADLSRKIGFAKARVEGKVGEGVGADIYRMHEERRAELEKMMPEVAKKWEPLIDQANKNDAAHTIVRSIGGSLPSTLLIMGTAPISMPGAAVAGFIAMYSQNFSDAQDEFTEGMKKAGKKVDPKERDNFAHIKAASQTPMEEVGDVLGARMFTRILHALPKDLMGAAKAPELAKWIEKHPNWWTVGKEKAKGAAKELGPTLVAEGLITNPIQSIEDDIVNEAYGLQDKTSPYDKLVKAGKEGLVGATAATVMWGLPTAGIAAARAARLSAAAAPTTVPAGGPVVPGYVPGGTLTGAAAQMGGGAAPFTPPGTPAAAAPAGAPAAGPSAATPTTPAAATAAPTAEPAPVAHDAPEADQKARAGHMWDNAKAGDKYTWTAPTGVQYDVEISQNKKGERKAVVTSQDPEYEEDKGHVVTIGIDSKTAKPTEGDGMLIGSGMTRATEPTVIEPTSEEQTSKSTVVKDSKGRKGEVKKEEGGVLTVDWEDDTQSQVSESEVDRKTKTKTVEKNTVMLEPYGQKGNYKVVHYDKGGKRTEVGGPKTSLEQATELAKGITKENNYAGYYDESGNLVRERGKPAEPAPKVTAPPAAPPAPVTPVTQPVSQPAPGTPAAAPGTPAAPETAVAPAEETELPGPTEEQQRAILLGGKQISIAPLWLQKLSKAVGIDLAGMTKTRREIVEQLKTISYPDLQQSFLNFKVGGQTIKQILDEKVGGLGAIYDLNDRASGTIGGVFPMGQQFTINPLEWLADMLSVPEGHEVHRDQLFHDQLGEELIHIAQEKALLRDYNSLSPRDKARYEARGMQSNDSGYTAFVREQLNKVIDDIEGISKSLPQKERRAVEKMLIDMVNAYRVPLEWEKPSKTAIERARGFGGKVGDMHSVFDFLRGGERNPSRVSTIIEILRMAQQYRKDGKITEETLAKVSNPISRWFKNLIRHVMQSLGEMYGPKPSEAGKKIADYLKDYLDKVDNILSSAEIKNAQKTTSMTNPYVEGSPELDSFRGNTTYTIDEETGKHLPVFHVNNTRSQLTQGLGIAVGFRHDVFLEAMRETKDPEIAMGYIGMPLHIRLERPAKMQSIGNPQDHPKLRDYLEKKGYDGIIYPGGAIVFHPTQLINAAIPAAGELNIVHGKAKGEQSFENKVVEAHNANEGSSTNMRSGMLKPHEEVWMVGCYPDMEHKVKGRFIAEQDVMDFLSKLRAKGVEMNTDHLSMGTWYDRKNDETVFDVSAKVPLFRPALQIAEQFKQQGIWDNIAQETIYLQHSEQVGGLPAISERLGFIGGKVRDGPRLSDPYSFNITNLPPGKVEGVPILSDEGIIKSAIGGEKWKDWYDTYDKFMRQVTDKHPNYRGLFAWFFAATSPSNLVGANIAAAMRAFKNYVDTGDPGIDFDKMEAHKFNLRRSVGMFPTGAVNEPSAVGGGLIGGGTGLSGGKVPEFAPATLGDPFAMAVDMHVSSVLFQTKEPTEWQRFAGQVAMMRVAKRMGWKWAEVQAAIFSDHIIRTEGVMARAEKYMEQYVRTFEDLVSADQHLRAGRGARVGGQILERASKRIGPERFLKDEGGIVQATRAERERVILDSQGRPAREMEKIREAKLVQVDPVVASKISLRGPPGEIRGGKSRSASSPATTAFERRVPNAWFRLPRLYNGTKQVMWNSPGLAGVGDAIHKHTDRRKKYMGEYTAPLVRWERTIFGVPNLPSNIGKPTMRSAVNQHAAWRKAKAGKQPLPSLTPAAKGFKDTLDALIAKINIKNSTMAIKVRHPDTGKMVPIPHMEYPAKIREDILAAMRDGHTNQPQFRELWDGLVAEGILPKTATETDVQEHVLKVLSTHDSNGAFGRFFFFPKTMPSIAYDYGYSAFHEFLMSWTERLSQHESFGANPHNDIFDFAIANTTDTNTKGYIRTIKDSAYGHRVNDVWGRFSVLLGHLASFKHLAGFAGALKNLVTGMGFNAAALGPKHFLIGLSTTVPFRASIDAIERGILIRDLPNVLTDGEQIQGPRGITGLVKDPTGVITRAGAAVAQAGLKVSGFNAAETWTRGVSMRGLESLLRQAIKAYKKNPRSGTTLRYMSHFQRLGFRQGRAELLMQENGKGDLTDEFLRAGVNEIQGGYTYADVPVYMESPVGRALFKYQKWGAEQSKHFVREVLKPATRGIGLGKAETVDVLDPKTGNTVSVPVPRSVKELIPLAYYIFLVAGAAAGDEWMLEQLFGIHPKTIKMAQALERYRKGGIDKFNGFIEKLWMLHMHAGGFGALGSYIQDGLVFAGIVEKQGPAKSIAERIPALDPYLEFADYMMTVYEQGQVASKDIDRAFDSIALYRTSKQLAATQFQRLGYRQFGNDVIGQLTRQSQVIANKQDLSVVKNLKRRWEEETGQKKKQLIVGRVPKDPTSLWKEPLDDALSIGDLPWARQILRDAKKTMTPQRWELETDALKSHIRAKQPLGEGAANQYLFIDWARKGGATPYQLSTMRRMQLTYEQTARQLSIGMEFKPPTIEQIMDKRNEIRLKAQPVKAY